MITFSILLGVVMLLSLILGQAVAYCFALIMDEICKFIMYHTPGMILHDIVYYPAIVGLYAIMLVVPAVSMYIAMT